MARGNSGPPYVKVGAAVRYDERDLEQWIQERKRVSTTEKISKQRRSTKSRRRKVKIENIESAKNAIVSDAWNPPNRVPRRVP
jgi:hypothetical protein